MSDCTYTPPDATTSAHGLMPKLSGNPGQFLSGAGTWLAGGGGGGGASEFIAGVSVANYAALPAAGVNSGLMAVCLAAQGVWLINYFSKGVYISDGATWNYLGDYQVTSDGTHISIIPSGNIASTDVQAALYELDTEKVPTTRTVNSLPLSADVVITDANISTSDVVTNNFSTAKHGFTPKGTGVGNYLRDDGTWAAVSGGGGATPTQFNQSVAAQSPFATDTYLTGSSIAIPASNPKVGTRYKLIFNVTKTAAGTAAPTIIVRFGTLGTTGDAARLTFTFGAQTAVVDNGTFEVFATFRTVGAGTSAVLQGVAQRRHALAATGLGTNVADTFAVTSAGFDSTVASSIIGVSVNGGASAAWTVQLVLAELENLV